MVYDEELAARVRRRLGRRRSMDERKMFGGVGFLLRGNMVVGVWKEYLIARVGPDSYDAALREEHVRQFDITGRAMRGWVMVAPDGVVDDQDLNAWLNRCLSFAESLPAKEGH